MKLRARLTKPFSVRFWDAIQRPPVYHPFFRKIAVYQFRSAFWDALWTSWTPQTRKIAGAAFGIVALVGVFTVPQLLTFMIFVLPIISSVLTIFLYGTWNGLQQCLRVSGMIARSRASGMFDLLAVAPLGGFGVSWILSTGSIYYALPAGGNYSAHRIWISRILFLALFLLISLMTLATPYRLGQSASDTLFGVILTVAFMSYAFHVDDVLSSVLGVLTGMITPLMIRGVINSQAVAVASYLCLQILAYLSSWFMGFVLLPSLAPAHADQTEWAIISIKIAQIALFFFIRDTIARILWVALHRMMSDTVGHLQQPA